MLSLLFSLEMFILVYFQVIPYQGTLKWSKQDENKYSNPSKGFQFFLISFFQLHWYNFLLQRRRTLQMISGDQLWQWLEMLMEEFSVSE